MNDVAKPEAPVSYAKKAWQSDVIVDLLRHYDFPYIALNPGASYRGLARFAGQLRRQSSADLVVPAREDRRADRSRLRQGDRPADGGDRARYRRHAACHHGHLLRLYRSLPGLRHRRHRSDGRKPPPAVHRLDPHRQRQRRAAAPLREVGLPAGQHRRRAGFLCARLCGDDDRAAGPDLHVLRRLAAGAAAGKRRRAAAAVDQQSAGADGRRQRGAGRGRRPAAGGEISRC